MVCGEVCKGIIIFTSSNFPDVRYVITHGALKSETKIKRFLVTVVEELVKGQYPNNNGIITAD